MSFLVPSRWPHSLARLGFGFSKIFFSVSSAAETELGAVGAGCEGSFPGGFLGGSFLRWIARRSSPMGLAGSSLLAGVASN